MADEVIKRLANEVNISEAMLVGCFYNDIELYNMYDDEKVSAGTFSNDVWGFFFNLGRHLVKKGAAKFDDITVQTALQDLGPKFVKRYEKYGGYDTIAELTMETKNKSENFDAYYEETKKYETIMRLYKLFGEQVVTIAGKYDYKKLNREQIFSYWMSILNDIGMNNDNSVDEYYLLQGIDEEIKKWDEEPNLGIPFYKSHMLTKLVGGFADGNMYIYSAFSGTGKTSFITNKIILSHIEEGEKLLIIANEQDKSDWTQYLLITAMAQVGVYFDRQRLNEGNFTNEEKEKLKQAQDWIKAKTQDEKSIILVFLENYNMPDVERTIRKWVARGVGSVIVDTAKPTDDASGNMARWENFYESANKLYQLCRRNAGGLNFKLFLSVQSSDTATNRRFLDETVLAESKKIKNLASILWLARWAFQDEYEGGKKSLDVYRWKHEPENPFANSKGFIKVEQQLKPDKRYVLLFTNKNRRGKSLNTGAKVLVFEVDLNRNSWIEIGWTIVKDDR